MSDITSLQTNPGPAATAVERYVFRETSSEAELEALLRFRYENFRASRLGSLIPENNDGMDLDRYDINAHHFALFAALADGAATLVGYARFVGETPGPLADAVVHLAKRYPDVTRRTSMVPGMPLPCLEDFPEANSETRSGVVRTITSSGPGRCLHRGPTFY